MKRVLPQQLAAVRVSDTITNKIHAITKRIFILFQRSSDCLKVGFPTLDCQIVALSISGLLLQLDRTHPLPRAILTGWLFQRPVIFDVDYLRDSQNNLWFMCSCWVYIYHCLDRVGTATSCLYVAAVLGSLQGTDFHSSRFLIDKHDLWFHYFVFYDRIRSVESVLLLPISANQSGLFKNLLTYFGSHWLILCGFEVEL